MCVRTCDLVMSLVCMEGEREIEEGRERGGETEGGRERGGRERGGGEMKGEIKRERGKERENVK